MKSIGLLLINIYQKYISPRKGFKCAYGQITGRWTCSSFGKIAISKHGLLKGVLLINRQMKNCERLHFKIDGYGDGCAQDTEKCKSRNC
tara:strand:- start:3078 stop:3344 length:267 start_codon:yes stop_codon:yes gene_type:complete